MFFGCMHIQQNVWSDKGNRHELNKAPIFKEMIILWIGKQLIA